MQFTELNLAPYILRALDEMGYEDMTPIQEQTIPHIIAGKDVMGLAETGSGKTGACAIPLIQATDDSLNAIQALILVPTRELALQYVQEVDEIAKHSGVVPFAIYGGFDMDIQKAKINHGVHVLVATPGRLIDFIWNHSLDLTHVKTVVLDEADEMLKMGFIEDVDFILSCIMQEHQTLLFFRYHAAGDRAADPTIPQIARAHPSQPRPAGTPITRPSLPPRLPPPQ